MSFNEKDMNIKYIEQEKNFSALMISNSKIIIEEFKKLVASKGVTLNDSSFSYTHSTGIIASYPKLAEILLGDVSIERDGLFSFEEIIKKTSSDVSREGCFIYSKYIIMADSCFRRGMHPMANWAPGFIALFWQLESSSINKYISIDIDRVKIDRSSIIELDTWYGAPFNNDISKIKNGITKLSPPLDISDSVIGNLFAENYCLDICWNEKGQIKTFQALEIKNENIKIVIDGEDFFPARYLHAEFDLIKGEFRHFDGSIQYFTKQEYFKRRESDFNMVFKDTEHIKANSKKVFKLNGSISVKHWADFCSQFFVKNPLIIEYFTGNYPQKITDTLNRMRSK